MNALWSYEIAPGTFQVKRIAGEERGRLIFEVVAEFSSASEARGFILRRYAGINL